MGKSKYGILLASALAACTFTTADVGPTARSLRSAHDSLAGEFSALDAKLVPSVETVNATCPTPPGEQTELVRQFCRDWSGLNAEQRARRARELALAPRINDTLAALLAYVEALDALVKSREQSEVQADLLEARINGLNSVSAALGGSATLISSSAAGLFANAAAAFDEYNRTRAALRAAEQAQPGLDLLALGVREVFGECEVEVSEAMARRLARQHPAVSAAQCSDAARAYHERIVHAVVLRESTGAELQHEVAYTLYRSEAPDALARLRQAYDDRAEADANSPEYHAANRAVDIALRDLDALERVRPQYEAVIAAERTAEQWAQARTRGRRDTVRAFIQAADQNAALSEAIRRDRQLDLGPLGFIIRSLLGA